MDWISKMKKSKVIDWAQVIALALMLIIVIYVVREEVFVPKKEVLTETNTTVINKCESTCSTPRPFTMLKESKHAWN